MGSPFGVALALGSRTAGSMLAILMPHGSMRRPPAGSCMRWQRAYSEATEAVRKLVHSNPGGPGAYSGTAGGGAGGGAGGAGAGGPYARPTLFRLRLARFLQLALPVSGIAVLGYAWTHPDSEPLVPTRLPPQLQYLAAQQTPNQEVVVNWSGTHQAKPKRYFFPQTEAEVEAFVRLAHDAGQRLRVAGSCLSPNGLGLSEEGMMGMALLDKVLAVDKDKKQVTVQAGCRVQQLADALKPHGLTLQNYASIREQQIGGFIQVGAHGTGATIPPVDGQVVSMRMATPAVGLVTLSAKDEPELFSMAKVGLGALGVVTQVTLQCVPRHQLREVTTTHTQAEVKKNHAKWIRDNQHLRYMWIPYTDTVVVVRCNPVNAPDKKGAPPAGAGPGPGAQGEMAPHLPMGSSSSSGYTDDERVQPLKDLYLSRAPNTPSSDLEGLSATALRDRLLELDPLSKDWVSRVNAAEAEFWRRSAGERVGYSDEILGFDCGGQQWVLESAFKVADSLDKVPERRSRDMEYMDALLAEIKRAKVPAPSPIEQRWTSGSSSAMSPAAGPPGSVHCWVGVIMYLPEDEAARQRVTSAFKAYVRLVQERVMPKFDAVWHWAKLEPDTMDEATLRRRLAARFPVAQFGMYRTLLDPKDVLGNEWLDRVLPRRPA